MNASKEIHRDDPQMVTWQRSFHDHVVRNEQDFQRIWQYIETNPVKWTEDCFYCPDPAK